MRFTVVPQTGHLPLAIRIPVFVSVTSPVKSRFSLHFTQKPLYCSATLPSLSRAGGEWMPASATHRAVRSVLWRSHRVRARPRESALSDTRGKCG